MAELGLGYDVARELNPGIIMASTCLHGPDRPGRRARRLRLPRRRRSAGFYEVTGWDDRPPGGPFNAYTDTIAPRFLTTTLLAALDHRRRTGEGQFIDQAQMESSLHFLAPELLDVQVSAAERRAATATATRRCAPHDAYPCAGDDQWCAIAVETDAQWQALRGCSASRRGRRTPDARHASPAAARSVELIDARARRASPAQHEPRELMDAAPGGRRAGRDGAALERPPGRPAAGAPRVLPPARSTPRWARCPYEGHQFRIPATTTGRACPAPCLGEHTYEVLRTSSASTTTRSRAVLSSGACG